MLILVPSRDEFAEARLLLHVGEMSRSGLLLLLFALLPLVSMALWAAGLVWACPLIGAAVGLALIRFGPHWWPGRR